MTRNRREPLVRWVTRSLPRQKQRPEKQCRCGARGELMPGRLPNPQATKAVRESEQNESARNAQRGPDAIGAVGKGFGSAGCGTREEGNRCRKTQPLPRLGISPEPRTRQAQRNSGGGDHSRTGETDGRELRQRMRELE